MDVDIGLHTQADVEIQQQEQQQLQIELQRLQRVQDSSELNDAKEEGETCETENANASTENVSQVFLYVTEVPSIKDLRKIQIETLPGSPLRAKVLGPNGHGTPLAAIGLAVNTSVF